MKIYLFEFAYQKRSKNEKNKELNKVRHDLLDSYQQFVYYLNLTIIDRLSVDELKIKIMEDEYNKVSKKKRNKFVNGENIIEFDVVKYVTTSVKANIIR